MEKKIERKNRETKQRKQIKVGFPRGGQQLKIQYYEPTCSGAGEKETQT